MADVTALFCSSSATHGAVFPRSIIQVVRSKQAAVSRVGMSELSSTFLGFLVVRLTISEERILCLYRHICRVSWWSPRASGVGTRTRLTARRRTRGHANVTTFSQKSVPLSTSSGLRLSSASRASYKSQPAVTETRKGRVQQKPQGSSKYWQPFADTDTQFLVHQRRA